MKNYLFLFSFILPFVAGASIIVMPRVDAGLFINNPQTDFETIYLNKPADLKKAVEWLFDQDKLSHDWTKAMSLENKFPKYWELFQSEWHLIDMNQDGQPELLFSGKPYAEDDKELFSLYAQYGSVWKEIYWDDGHLIAYKIHPRTKEILLYHHRYPCCTQSTHAIVRLRYLNNEIYQMKRYFLARDTGMKGQFFPSKSDFKANYKQLEKITMMYWSKGKIETEATQYILTNEIIHYPIGALYKVLAKEENWIYVQMISPPLNESSPVVNSANLKDVKFFGWIEEN